MSFGVAQRIVPIGLTVRTIREGVERVEGQPEQLPTGRQVMPRGVYERKPKDQETAPKRRGRPPKAAAAETPKRRGRPPKGANGSYAGLLAGLRAEREKLVDKVTAIGTAIEALEALA